MHTEAHDKVRVCGVGAKAITNRNIRFFDDLIDYMRRSYAQL